MNVKKFNSLFVICVVLTAIVLHTCIRIELLNDCEVEPTGAPDYTSSIQFW